ncbi:hypothetical protein LNAT_P0294 [Lebetimonas natsushimae]|uniref:Uncharacterized protein n=1 Tax=Lebetimonas natsushimae TaxID=1936991 RepID=A0A292YBU1_9BACT|nr:hypothetical protein [Lebetimonas natsushimae]GAX86999.1 hypothetical protein LNAT_P0294 [Lebetimonas natsushimae]
MKETKAQIRPLLRLSIISTLEFIKAEKNKSLGAIIEELLLENPNFRKYFEKWKNRYNY